jgi:hypothetical protein
MKKLIITTSFLLVWAMPLIAQVTREQADGFCVVSNAQHSLNASGGNATGNGGTAAYSVGQIVYKTLQSEQNVVFEGIQYAYEIFDTGVENPNYPNLNFTVYPNPATDKINLSINGMEIDNLSFKLFDINGKLLMDKKITSDNTSILMDAFSASTYLLTVYRNMENIKSFKIIKK